MENKNIPILRFPEFEGEWEIKKLGENIETFSGGTPKSTNKDYYSGDIPFIKSGEINSFQTEQFITEDAIKNSSAKIVEKGDLLYALYGATSGELGISKISGAINQAVLCIRPKKDIDKIFLYQYLSYMKNRITTVYLQGGQGNLSAKIIRDLKINFPSHSEQQKIASFLSAIDKRISVLEQKKTKLEEYKKGIMQKIFSQEYRFKDENGNDFPKWEKKRLGEISERTSSNIAISKIKEDSGEYKLYGATGFLTNIDTYQEDSPYIAIIKDGAGVGRTQLCEPKSSVLATLDKLKPKNDNDLYFLYLVLNQIRFERYITGSTIPHIYFSDYKSVKISVPTLKEQQKISSFLSTIDIKIEKIIDQIEQTKSFKNGLLQQMFV